MKIHEYQAKAILAEYGIPVPKGGVATTPGEVAAIARRLGGRVVVKAQIHAGGRGKGGGVKLARSPEEAEALAREMIGMTLVTPQTGPAGLKVRRILREHVRAPRGWHRIADADRPRRTPPKTLALLEAAMRIGAAVSTICDHIHRHDGEAGVRRILGVLSLAKKHGPAAVEDAAHAALDLGVPTYRFLRRYLERRPPVPLTLRQVDPLIRQLTLYRDLIDRTTGDPS